VEVSEGISQHQPNIMYDLDFQLNVISATIPDGTLARYRELEAEGKIPKSAHLTDGERLKREVKVIRHP
jgi:hypothetical protein